MSEPIVHLLRAVGVHPRGPFWVFWCDGQEPGMSVTEALFATCTACLEARSRAASAVKPTKSPEVNLHG